ncbi:putative glycosyl transferase [Bergeriella denitrificans]|uniref:Putative glycosyl transferase n=2 Tax=Bergeriella denitrificans TaxID=494 RepID=A0A378UHQ7_BERDE|nr:CDP-glycerol glycerophosphotransferase family protein [Bergeriella denitrificans]STZ76012.1 putative glycosyl transferase [Bergeriella denitrificans]
MKKKSYPSPFNTPLSYWHGLILYRKQKWKEAQSYFQKAVELSPKHSYANFKLGMCFFKQKKWEEALKYFEIALSLNSTNQEKWSIQFVQAKRRVLASTSLAGASTGVKESLLREKIELGVNTEEAYAELAKLLHKQGRYWQEIDALNKVLSLPPVKLPIPELYIQLANAHLAMKQYGKAFRAFQAAIDIPGKHQVSSLFYKAGYCIEHMESPDNSLLAQATTLYAKAISKDSQLSSRKFGIGVFHEKEGLWPEAIKAYKKELSDNPQKTYLYEKLGFAYQKNYEWANAKEYFQLAINAHNIQNPEWHYRLGFNDERLGNYESAVKNYSKAVQIKYTAYWYYRLGICLSYLGKDQEAVAAFLKTKRNFKPAKNIATYLYSRIVHNAAQELDSDTTQIDLWEKFADLYFSKGDLDKACEYYYNYIIRNNEHNTDAYYKYGFLLAENKQFGQAAEVLKNIRILREPYGTPLSKFDNNEEFRRPALYMEYFRHLSTNPDIVLFESFSGVGISCNPFAIFMEMISDVQYKDFLFVWVVSNPEKIPNDLKKYKNVIFVEKNSDLYLRYLCTAKYLINNSTFPPYFIRKEDQLYLNTWHGTPWKTMGKDIKNNFMELKNTQRNFLQTTHMLSPNPHTTWALTDRYDITEIYSGKLLESGYPRIDLTLNASEEKKDYLRKELNIIHGKKIILYAPTWRGTLGSPEVESEKLISEIELLAKLDANILFRGHYFVEENAYDSGIGRYIVPEHINTNELLSIVDILITDYSSIAFDYMATGKPIIYYIDDYEDYKEKRGLYFEVTQLPGVMAKTADELYEATISLVNNSSRTHSLYPEAMKKFTPYDNGDVTKRVINWFFKNQTDNNEISLQAPTKKSLLFFGGEFMPNGITASLINLLTNIDKEKYTVSLLIDPNAIASDEKRLEQFYKLPSDIRIIPRVGRMNRTVETDWIEFKANIYKYLPKNMEPYFNEGYKYEFQRMVGFSNFDALIEFSGYSRFWTYVLGAADLPNAVKSIYQHNDLYGEWKMKYPRLENTFGAYHNFDKIISVSKPTMELNKQNLASIFQLDENKFDYCDNVQNPDFILNQAQEELPEEDFHYFAKKNRDRDTIFINLARLSPEKNQAKLINSFRKLVDTYPTARLLILGDGPLKTDLSQLIRDSDLNNNVYLLGSRFNPFPFLKHADCFVLSSDHEGQPMTLFEAMILKKPVIATDIVGSRSVLENRPGLLVPNNEEGLLQGMIDFIEGKLYFGDFDYSKYQKDALDMFYSKVSHKKNIC